MSLLVKPETHRIDLDDGEWVEVRKHMTIGDRAAVNSRAIIFRADMVMGGDAKEPTTAQMTMDAGAWGLALLQRMITAWSDLEPVTPQNIALLPEATADHIRAEIDRLNAGRDEAEKKGSTVASLSPSEVQGEEILAGVGGPEN
jgi:hypothetical protein